VVCLSPYLQYAGHPGDNLHLWIQQEEIITRNPVSNGYGGASAPAGGSEDPPEKIKAC
jgi:hypothetical protein